MKTDNVVLCDVCKNMIAKAKCWMCDKDLCLRQNVNGGWFGCLRDYTISFYNNLRVEIPVCYDCSNKIEKTLQEKDNKDILVDFQKWLIEKVKKRLMTSKLKDGNK